MEAEIPIALIRSFQSTAREQAGVPWYDPSVPTLPGFPASLREAVAEADSGVPPYLKCNQCCTALPRGLQSATCAHCGVEQRREIPLSLSFISTVAYRNFLESLGLDGSETVVLDADPPKTSKGKGTVKSDMSLSSLLDIELRWPSERKDTKTVSSSNPTAQRNPPPSLSAADLDNIFIEKKAVSPGTHKASQLSFDSESFDVFQNLRSSDSVTSTNTNDKGQHVHISTHLSSNSGDFAAYEEKTSSSMIEGSTNKPNADSEESFADWQADFQSAGPGTSLFRDSSMLGKAATYNDNEYRKEANAASKVNHSSVGDKWIFDELRRTSSEENPNKEKNATVGIGETAGGSIQSSGFDNLWPVSSGGLSAPASKNQDDDHDDDSFDVWQDFSTSKLPSEERPNPLTQPVNEYISKELNRNDDDDSYDVWQDFSGSNLTFETFPNSITQNVATEKVHSGTSGNGVDDPFDVWQDFSSSKGATSGLFTGEGSTLSDNAAVNKSANLDFEDVEFGNFFQSGVFSGTASVHDNSTDSKNSPLEAYEYDRNNPMETKQNSQDDIWTSNPNEVSHRTNVTHLPDSSSSSVESLLSQMHDLSFMLKDDLSIPRTVERFS